jgi:DNA-binding MarR family transcriptional regulator
MIDTILELKSRCGFAEEIGRAYGFTAQDVNFMMKIAQHPDSTLKELAEYNGLSISRASRIVSRLKGRGFVAVVPDEQDRRAVRHTLSEKGVICYDDIIREKAACEARLRNSLTDEQERLIRQGLDLLLEII